MIEDNFSMDNFVLRGEELYNKENIRIHKGEHSSDTYDVVVGDKYVHFPRGTMRELLSEGPKSLERIYSQIAGLPKTGNIKVDLGITSTELGFALSQARIKELEEK